MHIFCPSLWVVLSLDNVLWNIEVFILMKLSLFFGYFIFWCCIQQLFTKSQVTKIPGFLCFIAFALTFRSLISLGLIFYMMWGKGSCNTIVEKTVLSSCTEWLWHFCQKAVDHGYIGLFLDDQFYFIDSYVSILC